MSRFFEALERAKGEQALRTQPGSPRAPAGPSASPPSAASAEEVLGGGPPVFRRPDVTAPAPVTELGVDRSKHVDDLLVSLLTPTSFEAEQYRVLRHVVETLRKSASLQVVAVTSPGVGDGKTTTAINLAGALAQAPLARVLLADVDFRSPAVTRPLGLGTSCQGLLDMLLQPELTLATVVRTLPQFNLSVLPAGSAAVAPYEAFKLPRLQELLEQARQRYDYVVLDAPPFVPVPDCRLLAGHVDGFLMVVAAHRTPRKEVAEALGLMDPAKVVGLVFNRDEIPMSTYYNVQGSPPGRGRTTNGRG